MNSFQPPSSHASKLFIRSEVLAVLRFLSTVEEPPKQDKLKQLKRLATIEDQPSIQKILVQELRRARSGKTVQAICELLMDLGTLDVLHTPLWTVIESPNVSDEVRDAANLILRQLGDQSDPNLYLDYLEDPAGLINRETERMLEVSTRNPEALIDFIDFIFSLPVDEQGNLLRSLQVDYPPQYLVNIYLPLLDAQPPLETQALVLSQLGQIRDASVARFLHQHAEAYANNPALAKPFRQAVNSLRIAGLYRDDLAEAEREVHPVVTHSRLYQCFATIADGIGNQGIVISREKENGDIVMMSAALNDCHGVIDCFGFYELSQADFHKLAAKFHEESSKIAAPPAFCLAKLREAEAVNRQQNFRIPYEYTCWKVLLDDIAPADAPAFEDRLAQCRQWETPAWEAASINLYQHPDFCTWFLEEGDHPAVSEPLQAVTEACRDALASESADALPDMLLKTFERISDFLVHALLATEWRDLLIHRLADAAYLLNAQGTQTFCSLAATEAIKLEAYNGPETALSGFTRQYGRRCLEEHLLRLRHDKAFGVENQARFSVWVDAVLETWEPA